MTLGKRIEGARLARGYDEAATFARACAVSRQYLNNLEKDKVSKPDPSQLNKIAQCLNVTLDWLWTGTGLPNRNQLRSASELELVEKIRALKADQRKQVIDLIHKFNP